MKTWEAFKSSNFRLITQIASLIQAGLVTLVVSGGNYNVWIIIALSALLGLINAFDVPVRQTIVYELAHDDVLPNSLALNSSMVNLTRLLGPGLAGFILKEFGKKFIGSVNTYFMN